MNLRSALMALIASFTFASCLGCGSSYSFQNVGVTISPQIASIPVNGSQVFTTTTTNAPNDPIFDINGDIVANTTPGLAGFFSVITGAGGTPEGSITYHAPATPPIYTSKQVAAGFVQGSVTVNASVPNNPHNFFSISSTSVTFVITGPISAGVSPTSATVKLGTTQQFTGYSVGSTNNALTWQVNGVAGGSTANGAITSTGLYTAPANMPMTGNTVTITAVAQADPTQSASATVTLTQ